MPGHVLVVEDSQLLASLLGDALRAHGVASSVEVFADGAALLARYRAHLESGAPVALLVIDINLPKSSGLDVGRSARALEQERGAGPCPVVFFSSRAEDAEIASAVADCFPARFVHKIDRSGPAQVALEGARLIRSLFGAAR